MKGRLQKELSLATQALRDSLNGRIYLRREIVDPKDFTHNVCSLLSYCSKASRYSFRSLREDFSSDSLRDFQSILAKEPSGRNFIHLCMAFLAADRAMEHYQHYLKNKLDLDCCDGNVADVGAGFTCDSSALFAQAIRSRKTSLFLVEKYALPILVEERIIRLLGLDNVRVLRADAAKVPVERGFFKEIHLHWSLHEFASRFYAMEDQFKLNRRKLTRKEMALMQKDYVRVLKEMIRVLAENGDLLIKDHVLNKYYFCGIWEAAHKTFVTPDFEFTVHYSRQ